MPRGAFFPLLLILAPGCAPLRSTVEVTGTPGAPGRGPVPVYYGLAPPFPTREVGAIDAWGQGPRAHLEDLLEEAEARARALGAEALLVRDVRTAARYVPRTEMRPCSRGGPGGLHMQFMCPVTTLVLEVDMHLRATAVRRGDDTPALHAPWGSPPPPAPVAPWSAPPNASPPTEAGDAGTPPR